MNKSDYFYFQKKITELDELKSEAENINELNARDEVLRERESHKGKIQSALNPSHIPESLGG